MKTVTNESPAIVKKAKTDKDILAVILFGSYARKEPYRDIDICLVLYPKKYDKLFLSRKKLTYLTDFQKTDIQIYQQLPIYIRTRVLKEGKIIYCKNKDALYDIAIETIKDFNDFEPRYKTYLEGVMNA